LYRLAAHRERIVWLEQLFPRGVSDLPSLANNRDKSHALNALAISYEFSGQPSRAVPLFRRSEEVDAREHNDGHRLTGLSNLGEALREMGALREAGSVLQSALILNHRSGDDFGQAICLQNLGRVFATQDHPIGVVALRRAQHIFTKQGEIQSEGIATAFLAEHSIWLGKFTKASALADEAWELASDAAVVERDFIRAALLQGRAALGLGNLTQADERLHHALARTRAVDVVEFELPALIAIAELKLAQGDLEEARACLDDFWEGAELGPYRLRQADAYSVLADIERAAGNELAAVAAATEAHQAGWCDGPPYTYHWGLEKAKAHLAALGAPEPDMPPFDDSKFEPMPEVDINPKDKDWVDPKWIDSPAHS
jgi:tetratricopeptide (TPR) repeat protein